MSKLLLLKLLVALLLVLVSTSLISPASANDDEYHHCDCEEGFWSIHSILECQRVSDFLIAIAYFSIPCELLYFLSNSNLPFKWVLLQFIAFIVLCGLTHLLNGWTYYGPHSFHLMMALTIAKLLTALVSCATAITLLTLIPLLLKIKVREIFLKQNVLELDQEVGMMKKQKEAGWHVRMLTQEIRKSLDKHTILYTTLVELSKTLELQNCAVWMLDENKTEMNLTHELRSNSSKNYSPSIPINDPDILEITKTKGVRILGPNSKLGSISSGGSSGESGPVAAIRMPMLRVSNFKGGTPELVETCYALLILVLPANERSWSIEEMEIVEVVADQVAVALSHAAVLEESQLMREKLGEQNRVLQQAKENAMMASQARNSFQKVMSQGIRRPMHSILGLLSMFQDDSLTADQRIIIETILKTSNVLSTLINDVMEIPTKDSGKFPLQMSPFSLRSMIKEASCLIKCLCIYKGFGFSMDIFSKLPNEVIGDERRTFQVLFHMVGHFLNVSERGGSVVFRVSLENGIEGRNDRNWGMRRVAASDESAAIKFEIGISDGVSQSEGGGKKPSGNEFKDGLSFTMCRKLVQMMQGDIWMAANSLGNVQSMNLTLRFQIQPAIYRRPFFNNTVEQQQPKSYSIYKGLQVILADDDGINRMVTKKLLEKLGCQVSAVSSGFECLSCLGLSATSVRVIILDLQMPEMDGFEVATRIRKFRSGDWPLIIALTASADENVWEKCLQVGMNGVIRKPGLLHALADEIRSVLQRAAQGDLFL